MGAAVTTLPLVPSSSSSSLPSLSVDDPDYFPSVYPQEEAAWRAKIELKEKIKRGEVKPEETLATPTPSAAHLLFLRSMQIKKNYSIII